MSETDLAARLDAVERALTDDETDLAAVRDDAERAAAVADLESRVADLEATVDELDAALQAVRGYAGNVRAVNREVERRASAALAKAETLESSVEEATEPREPGVISHDACHADEPSPVGGSEARGGNAAASEHCADGGSPDRDRERTRPSTATRSKRECTPADEGRPRADERHTSADEGRPRAREDRTGPTAERRRSEERRPRADGNKRCLRDEERRGASGSSDRGELVEGDDGTDSQTEQFIERVRDAL